MTADIDPSSARPQLAVSAAIFRDGKILLVRRARAPAKGIYTLPGGRVEFGETLVEALRREMREETSLQVEIVGLAGWREVLPEAAKGDRPFRDPVLRRPIERRLAAVERGARRCAVAGPRGFRGPADDRRIARYRPVGTQPRRRLKISEQSIARVQVRFVLLPSH